MKKLFFILLILSTTLGAEERSFNKIVYENQIDIKSKSLKSWMRIFNSREKIKSYGFTLSETERFTMLKGLKDKQKASKNRYSRKLK